MHVPPKRLAATDHWPQIFRELQGHLPKMERFDTKIAIRGRNEGKFSLRVQDTGKFSAVKTFADLDKGSLRSGAEEGELKRGPIPQPQNSSYVISEACSIERCTIVLCVYASTRILCTLCSMLEACESACICSSHTSLHR